MPAAGTKQVVIDGDKVFLPAEDADLATLTARGYRLTKAREAIDAEMKTLVEKVRPLADKYRNGRQKVTLVGANGHQVEVSWGNTYPVDQIEATRLETEAKKEKMLPVFEKVLTKKVEFKPAGRGKWRKADSAKKKIKDFIGRCKDAITTKEKNPSFKFDLAEPRP